MARSTRPDQAALLLAVASAALRYPSAAVLDARPELTALPADLPPTAAVRSLRRFLAWWSGVPRLELQQTYVETFDLHKRCSLYLTYYLFGDRRQRGQEFVRFKRLYEAAGWQLTGRELPDYLPLILEFAALEPDSGGTILHESRVGLELLRQALRSADSPYADLVDAVCLGLPALEDEGWTLVRRLAQEGPPGEQVGLEPFGPPEAMPLPGYPAR